MQRLTTDQIRFLDAERAIALFRENEECAHIAITDEWGEPRQESPDVHHLVDAFGMSGDSDNWRSVICADGKVRFVEIVVEEFDA